MKESNVDPLVVEYKDESNKNFKKNKGERGEYKKDFNKGPRGDRKPRGEHHEDNFTQEYNPDFDELSGEEFDQAIHPNYKNDIYDDINYENSNYRKGGQKKNFSKTVGGYKNYDNEDDIWNKANTTGGEVGGETYHHPEGEFDEGFDTGNYKQFGKGYCQSQGQGFNKYDKPIISTKPKHVIRKNVEEKVGKDKVVVKIPAVIINIIFY
jgi:hypothetical protein